MTLEVSKMSPAQYQIRSCIRSLLCGASIQLIQREIETREHMGDAFGRQIAMDCLVDAIADQQ
jgi:hypothetical protein